MLMLTPRAREKHQSPPAASPPEAGKRQSTRVCSLGRGTFTTSTRRSESLSSVYDLRSPWIEASVERLSLGIEASLYRKLAYATESLLGKRVDGYIFITRGLKDFYEDKLGRSMEPSRIVPSGVDLELFFPRDPEPVRKKLGIEEDDVVIGYVGVLSVERELEFALRALRELRDRDRRYRFMFVGDGDGSARLRRTALELGLGDGAIFTGRIGFNEVPDYISACDFGLCHLPDIPFFRHSFPMKVLEYAACGVPVLASRIPAHEEIAARLPLVLYSNSSPSSLAEAILDSTARTFPGVEKVREFGWEGIASRLVAVYRDVMGT